MMLPRALVMTAYVLFFVSFVFQSVPAAVGGAVLAFLAFLLTGVINEKDSSQ
jgi:hypothetical protein